MKIPNYTKKLISLVFAASYVPLHAAGAHTKQITVRSLGNGDMQITCDAQGPRSANLYAHLVIKLDCQKPLPDSQITYKNRGKGTVWIRKVGHRDGHQIMSIEGPLGKPFLFDIFFPTNRSDENPITGCNVALGLCPLRRGHYWYQFNGFKYTNPETLDIDDENYDPYRCQVWFHEDGSVVTQYGIDPIYQNFALFSELGFLPRLPTG